MSDDAAPAAASDALGDPARTVRALRTGLLALAAVTLLGVVVELASTRHWDSLEQVIPWVSCGVLLAALALVAFGGSSRALRTATVLNVVVGLSALFGVWEHVEANCDAGPLDFRYAKTWGTTSGVERAWLAVSGGVGPSPALVPLMLVLVAVLVQLAVVASPRPRATATPAL